MRNKTEKKNKDVKDKDDSFKTFYFSEFPTDFKVVDIYYVFKNYAEIE